MGRIAAIWPEEIDLAALRQEATAVLREVARAVEKPDDLALTAAPMIDQRLTDLLAGSEWYRNTIIAHTRPLCDAWRGATLAGREPTDHLLRSWLHLSESGLDERFLEMAVVFAIEPAALLPRHADPDALEVALCALPPAERLVTALYFQEQITLGEVSGAMKITPEEAQRLLGRSATALAGHVALASWPGRSLAI